MNGRCCEIGTIQAFLDGELTPVRSAQVTDHIADCDACAMLLARAEEEVSLVFPALEREFDTLVPTHRLWTRINESIVEEQRSAPFWRRFWSAVMVQIANPSIAAAAGVLIVFGLLAGIYSLRQNVTVEPASVDVAGNDRRAAPAPPVPVITSSSDDDRVNDLRSFKPNAPAAVKASYQPAVKNTPRLDDPSTPVQRVGYLPGEESYVKTIANLSETVNQQKDTALRPSARVNFERDMAVVDDAIKRTKSEVRKNPKNDSAKQVLYTSYQNKIDLLNSVAQREELVASMK